MKKKVIAFTIADEKNLAYAKKLERSLRKFHSEEELPFVIYTPKPWELNKDPHFFYRATPYYARELIKEYELVIKMDADQIITGKLDHILGGSADVSGVLNWNRVDPQLYGLVQVWDIDPGRYFNNGLVALRSEEFVQHWWKLCQSEHFDKYQYREQDLLNILIHYGNYSWECLDWGEHWNGLIAKGEWPRAVLTDDKVLMVLPDASGFPEQPKRLCVLHWAGGAGAEKMNYRLGFDEKVVEWPDYLTGDEGTK